VAAVGAFGASHQASEGAEPAPGTPKFPGDADLTYPYREIILIGSGPAGARRPLVPNGERVCRLRELELSTDGRSSRPKANRI